MVGRTGQQALLRLSSWSYTGNPGTYVKIELLKGGVLNRTIISSVSKGSSGSGSFKWRIPYTQTSGNDSRIKVTSTSNSSINDISDDDFTL